MSLARFWVMQRPLNRLSRQRRQPPLAARSDLVNLAQTRVLLWALPKWLWALPPGTVQKNTFGLVVLDINPTSGEGGIEYSTSG